MHLLDFLIGLTLVNAIPHFVLGIWKGRMLSGLGVGDTNNILYGILNFALSIGLFIFQYGIAGFMEHPIYLGGLFVVVSYFILGKLLYNYFHVRHYASNG